MDTSALVEAELAGDLELSTRLSEAAVRHEAATLNTTVVFVILAGRGDRAGFEADVLVRGLDRGIRAVAAIAVVLRSPDPHVAHVRRDLLREALDLRRAYAELTGDERNVGCELRPSSWIEGLYRDAIRRRMMRERLIKVIKAIRRHRLAYREE